MPEQTIVIKTVCLVTYKWNKVGI